MKKRFVIMVDGSLANRQELNPTFRAMAEDLVKQGLAASPSVHLGYVRNKEVAVFISPCSWFGKRHRDWAAIFVLADEVESSKCVSDSAKVDFRRMVANARFGLSTPC